MVESGLSDWWYPPLPCSSEELGWPGPGYFPFTMNHRQHSPAATNFLKQVNHKLAIFQGGNDIFVSFIFISVFSGSSKEIFFFPLFHPTKDSLTQNSAQCW